MAVERNKFNIGGSIINGKINMVIEMMLQPHETMGVLDSAVEGVWESVKKDCKSESELDQAKFMFTMLSARILDKVHGTNKADEIENKLLNKIDEAMSVLMGEIDGFIDDILGGRNNDKH